MFLLQYGICLLIILVMEITAGCLGAAYKGKVSLVQIVYNYVVI